MQPQHKTSCKSLCTTPRKPQPKTLCKSVCNALYKRLQRRVAAQIYQTNRSQHNLCSTCETAAAVLRRRCRHQQIRCRVGMRKCSVRMCHPVDVSGDVVVAAHLGDNAARTRCCPSALYHRRLGMVVARVIGRYGGGLAVIWAQHMHVGVCVVWAPHVE